MHAIISGVNSCGMIYVHVGFAFASTATMRWNLNLANSFLCHNSHSFVNKKYAFRMRELICLHLFDTMKCICPRYYLDYELCDQYISF